VKETGRKSQALPHPSTEEDIGQNDIVEVTEYNPPLEGRIKGITKIPRNLINAEVLESLGWHNFELKVCGSPEYLPFANLSRVDSSKCDFLSGKTKSIKF
jgi:hypothetical protein